MGSCIQVPRSRRPSEAVTPELQNGWRFPERGSSDAVIPRNNGWHSSRANSRIEPCRLTRCFPGARWRDRAGWVPAAATHR